MVEPWVHEAYEPRLIPTEDFLRSQACVFRRCLDMLHMAAYAEAMADALVQGRPLRLYGFRYKDRRDFADFLERNDRASYWAALGGDLPAL